MEKVVTERNLVNMNLKLPPQLSGATSTADSSASGRMKHDVMGSILSKLIAKSDKPSLPTKIPVAQSLASGKIPIFERYLSGHRRRKAHALG